MASGSRSGGGVKGQSPLARKFVTSCLMGVCGVPLLACPAVFWRRLHFALLDKPALAPIIFTVTNHQSRRAKPRIMTPVTVHGLSALRNRATDETRMKHG